MLFYKNMKRLFNIGDMNDIETVIQNKILKVW